MFFFLDCNDESSHVLLRRKTKEGPDLLWGDSVILLTAFSCLLYFLFSHDENKTKVIPAGAWAKEVSSSLSLSLCFESFWCASCVQIAISCLLDVSLIAILFSYFLFTHNQNPFIPILEQTKRAKERDPWDTVGREEKGGGTENREMLHRVAEEHSIGMARIFFFLRYTNIFGPIPFCCLLDQTKKQITTLFCLF